MKSRRVIIVVLFVLYLINLGFRPLGVPDEGRYAEIPREMLATQNFITPILNGMPYFEKPALFYWLQSLSLATFGLQEWAVRLVTLLMALLGIIATYFTGRTLYNESVGFRAAFILASSALYFAMAHIVTLDMTVSVWMTLCLYCFLLGERWYYGCYVFAALAVLTKGLIGFLLPGLIIFLWLCLTGQWILLKKAKIFSGLLLFLVMVVPWHYLAEQANPGFLHFYFYEQHFLRYLTNNAGRYKPFWFFIVLIPFLMLPWSFYLGTSLKKAYQSWRTQNNTTDLFLLIWAVSILLFFSVSHSKLIPYILPIFPPLALLIAHHTEDISTHMVRLGLGFSTCWATLLLLFPLIDQQSTKPIAEFLKTRLKTDDEVMSYRTYYQDLPFYLKRTITVVNYKGELYYGSTRMHNPPMIDETEAFKRFYAKKHRVFMVMSEKDYNRLKQANKLSDKKVVFKTAQNILVDNVDLP